jgi:hypothetical protein
MGSGGRGGTGGGTRGSGLNDGGSDAAEINSHGDCVIADTAPGTSCKPIYDDQIAVLCYSDSVVQTGPCGSYLVIEVPDSESMNRCFYDATTRRLVAEHVCSDVNQYCEGLAWCTWQGPDVGSCYSVRYDSLFTQLCPRPDAGTD